MLQTPHHQTPVQPAAFILEPDVRFGNAMVSLCTSVALEARHYVTPDLFWRDVDEASRGCLVTNAWLPGATGLQIQEVLRQKEIHLPVIVLSSHPDVHTAVESLKRGAFDFLEKTVSQELLLEQILRAVELDTSRAAERERIRAMRIRLAQLSRREREVLSLLVEGKTAKQTAADLGLSAKTVENHRGRIMEKTGARTFASLVRLVWEGAKGDLFSPVLESRGPSVRSELAVAAG